MKLLLLVIFSQSLFSSCSTVKDLFVGFSYEKEININASESQVLSKTGAPKFKIPVKDGEVLLLFQNGYVVTKNDLVVERGNYSAKQIAPFRSIRQSPGQYLLKNVTSYAQLPTSYISEKDVGMLIYPDGAIYLKNGIVFGASEAFYGDEIVFNITTNSFSNGNPNEGNYYISSGTKEISEDDLMFLEVKNYLRNSLRFKKMNFVDDLKKADFVLMLNYGISDPKERLEVISTPIYIPTYTPGLDLSVRNQYGAKVGSVESQGQFGAAYAGQSVSTVTHVSYNRWLDLHAFDYKIFKKSGAFKPVWKLTTMSEGERGDIRFVIPALVYASHEYTNEDSKSNKFNSYQAAAMNLALYHLDFNQLIVKRGLTPKE
jgi:hypothetical protein